MKPGFRGKIYLGLFALLLIQGLVLFFWVSQVMKDALTEEIKTRGSSIGTNLSARMVEPMLAMDFLQMKVLVDETVQLSDDIFYTFVLDKKGNALIHTFKKGFPIALKTANTVLDHQKESLKLLDTGDQLIYDYAVPVAINANRLGTLRVGLFQTRIQKAVNKIMISAVVTIIATILAAAIVGTLLLNPVTKSIKKLHNSSEQALRGNLDVRTAPMLKKNCWDIMQCLKKDCPAYKNYHHRCWYLAGTLCPTCVEGEFAKKIDSCLQCTVHKNCSGDEIQSLAESFDAMTLSLKGNLSDLKSAESILNEQKALLQTILDAIPDFISLQDHKGMYISVNKAFCEILNKNKNEIIGKQNNDLFAGKLAKLYEKEDQLMLETGLPLTKENRLSGQNGSRWLHVVKIPVRESTDRVKGLVCSGRDITQLKAVQEQLTHAQKMESVGRLAAGVAHEINTPLGIILGYAQLLLEDIEQKGQIHEDVKTIVKQTRICSKIVADLLNFSRSSESIISEFDINEAMEEVLGVAEHTFSLSHVTVMRKYHKTPLLMRGDKEKIKQVFINLLNNAFDAIQQDGSICVDTGAGETQNEITISISDTGHGIAKENIKKIFEPFYTTKGPDQGTGLGLSVTFGIIKEHNGTINVFSPPLSGEKNDRGSQFIVVLPSGLNRKKGELNGEYSRIG
ncbi:two-component system sensor histidine kinase NtrB [Desulfobacula toluolica]|uniref:histidine kinase n=1 Tax=Desulfobacula toluolica (strain DSM 7467 / Tol2) TaxID=651182 RepID=K0NCZ7_DESTT|nr:ATP-binding protein [Desulfobacula toluolica]CCK78590.1 two component system hybrid sensor protein [Desulfobacula toluolica Tol2]